MVIGEGSNVFSTRRTVAHTRSNVAMVLPFTRTLALSSTLLSRAARGSHIAIAPSWNPGY